jgi:GTP-binding protein EngB required for normal cell division
MERRDLLDIIDRLRSQGISQFVDLPQIIVCGDQSSGKSSVLEAISGMSFPTKDNLCTRFATELILRRSPSAGVKVNINPDPNRSSDEKKRLRAFEYTHEVLDISRVIEDAKDAMGLNGNDKVFSTDILRVEISGPSQPHLTMVDLPGLFLAGNKDQTEEDSKLVKSLVLAYMRKPRSIILAVVSAKSDFALQQVTQHTRALDPTGIRTLGLITKPDTLDEGSDSERFFVELAQNKDVQFRLGWHVLRNRSYAMRDASASERDRAEADLFSKGVWTTLEASQLGVAALRVRLSSVLQDQILMQLPSVLEDVKAGIKQCRDKLAKLGASRTSASEQRRYLLKASTEFSGLLKAAISGLYTDVFFASTEVPGAYSKRLRAVVQNTLSDFAEQMRTEGNARIIQDGPDFAGDDRCVSWSDYVEEVKALMKETRGRELPGTYNPLIVAELFSKQCMPWKGLVCSLSERILDSAYTSVNSVLQHIADEKTAVALLREVVGPSMENLKESLAIKVDEILEPHFSGHPITYNHYLTENVQKAQAARHRRELEKRLRGFFKKEELSQGATNHWFDMRSLLDTLVSHMEPDMDKFSCSMATDMMQAYYKVNSFLIFFVMRLTLVRSP